MDEQLVSLIINSKEWIVPEDKKLMAVLREDCKLKSVKDGCSAGACGTCTILVDGKAVKACVQKAGRFVGKSILTVEGLSAEEKELYVCAFGKAGAVQCGFCTPGMVLCAKALLDSNPHPSRQEIKLAIRNNLCRCTGYKKIIDAISLASKRIDETAEDQATREPKNTASGIGISIPRIDVREKVLGTGVYVDDMEMEGMLYGGAVRSAYPRARVLAIHTEEAKALPGVRGILTAEDIPGENKTGHVKQDWDTLIAVGSITHYLGDAICLIAAGTPAILEQAKALVRIEYEELPGVFSPEEALKPNAPQVHETGNVLKQEHLIRGNVEQAINHSAHVVTRHYSTPFTEHAFLEPECAIAVVDREAGEAVIYSGDQGTYDTQRECAWILGYEQEKVHVINKLVGGGFGGKEDMSVQHHAALLSWYTGSPVKVKLSRLESILVHPKRHPAEMEFTTACDENGILTAMKAVIITDTGAYASLGGPVLQRACTHAAGPYNYQNIDIEGTAVYTNNPPAGAFRGFGVTQSCFASECNLNLLAEMVGISPWEIRYRNAIRPGQELPNGQIAAAGTALVETLLAVRQVYDRHPYAGIACAMKNAGLGVGIPDYGRCLLTVEEGNVLIRSGASCIGQGLGTVLTQIICETTGLPLEKVKYMAAETNAAPDSGTTSGSRQTLITGEAARRAAVFLTKEIQEKLQETDRQEWKQIAIETQAEKFEKIEILEKVLIQLNGKKYYGEYLAETDPMGSPKTNPVSHVAYGYATQVAVLNEDGTAAKIVAAHDVGKAINPLSVEGQIEGGVVMSLGYALTERFPLDRGKPMAKLGTLGLFRADKTPDVESIIVEKSKEPLSYGAIGIGEITSIPTAAAVQGAYYRWDGVFRTRLPLEKTPYVAD